MNFSITSHVVENEARIDLRGWTRSPGVVKRVWASGQDHSSNISYEYLIQARGESNPEHLQSQEPGLENVNGHEALN